jgi:tetratricopeptide (TPR) repeat protein
MVRPLVVATVLLAFSFLAVVAADPNAEELVEQGTASLKKGDLDKAISDFSDAIRLGSKDPGVYTGRGAALHMNGELDDAIKDYTEAIRLDATKPAAYTARGIAWYVKGELDNAINDYTRAIQLDSKGPGSYAARGAAWRMKGDLENAIKDYTDVIRLAPMDAAAYAERGDALLMKGDLDTAIKDFNEAIKIDPKYFAAYNNLAWLQATCPDEHYRDGKKAVANAKQACEITEWKTERCLDTLAAAYAEAGDFPNAIESQQKAIALATQESGKQDMQERLELYEAGKPYREEPKK